MTDQVQGEGRFLDSLVRRTWRMLSFLAIAVSLLCLAMVFVLLTRRTEPHGRPVVSHSPPPVPALVPDWPPAPGGKSYFAADFAGGFPQLPDTRAMLITRSLRDRPLPLGLAMDFNLVRVKPLLDLGMVGDLPELGSESNLAAGTNAFASRLLELRARPLDLVLVLDATESMAVVQDVLSRQAGPLFDLLQQVLPGLRVGIVAYRDLGSANTVEVCALTTRLDRAREFLQQLRLEPGLDAQGRSDWPEAMERGLAETGQLPWRSEAAHLLVLIADAPPRTEGFLAARREALKFRAAHRRFLALHARTLTARNFAPVARSDIAVADSTLAEQQPTALPAAVVAALVENLTLQTRDALEALASDAQGKYMAVTNVEEIGITLLLGLFGQDWESHVRALWACYAAP